VLPSDRDSQNPRDRPIKDEGFSRGATRCSNELKANMAEAGTAQSPDGHDAATKPTCAVKGRGVSISLFGLAA